MGTVYRVRRLPAGELRVVKVMRRQILDDEDARKRFFREARLARALRHPNIAALEEFAEDDEHGLYMVLEYVDGPNLTELAAALGSLPVETVLDIGLQTLSALGEVHANGIVHRDVSPENLLLTLGEDGRLRVKLIDLGVAKDTGAEEKTQTGALPREAPVRVSRAARESSEGRADRRPERSLRARLRPLPPPDGRRPVPRRDRERLRDAPPDEAAAAVRPDRPDRAGPRAAPGPRPQGAREEEGEPVPRRRGDGRGAPEDRERGPRRDLPDDARPRPGRDPPLPGAARRGGRPVPDRRNPGLSGLGPGGGDPHPPRGEETRSAPRRGPPCH